MQVELDTSEAEVLAQLLQERCRELLFEISHTDHREYRRALEHRLELLEAVLPRIAPTSRASVVEVA
jgi:hypothetical protein